MVQSVRSREVGLYAAENKMFASGRPDHYTTPRPVVRNFFRSTPICRTSHPSSYSSSSTALERRIRLVPGYKSQQAWRLLDGEEFHPPALLQSQLLLPTRSAAFGQDDYHPRFPTLLVHSPSVPYVRISEYPILFYSELSCTVKNEGCHLQSKWTIVQSMGWIRMSERDLKRIEVLSEVLAGSHVSARSIIKAISAG